VFLRIQEAWQRRDYGPVRALALPDFIAKHEALLQMMRACHEVNRVEDLHIEDLSFVHIDCPHGTEPEAAALLTFVARAYFIDDRIGLYTRGPKGLTRFQEFWVFRRRGEDWLVKAIERSGESDRLERDNHVGELNERQMESAQQCLAL
jgi:predicted lipid-binding transport protein (Tim44 family)